MRPALLRLDPGGEGDVPDGDTAALQVDDLRLQQGTGLRMGGSIGDGGAAALHGEITVQRTHPPMPKDAASTSTSRQTIFCA